VLYWFICNRSLKLQNFLIVAASYFFYGWWSWKFLGLLVLITLLDYVYGFFVSTSNKRRAKVFLSLSVICNLGVLAIFKYYDFFAIQFQEGMKLLGLQVNPVLLNIALPIGISFYTFHGMSYVFDIYRQKQQPVKSIVDYAMFVSFFPLLVAGPIERASHLLPQIQNKRVFNYMQAVEGCRLILWGMFKKVVIADNLAVTVDKIFTNYSEFDSATLVIAAIAFSFQIYSDFSGYSDIAIGTAKLLGFELFSNFRFPYFSKGIADFWRRWHISLTSWFRDYLYIPLGGSRKNKAKTIYNIFIVFILSGLWHGANWNFVAWGCIHAVAFIPTVFIRKSNETKVHNSRRNFFLFKVRHVLSVIATFAFITFAWIFFRSSSFSDSIEYINYILIGLPNILLSDLFKAQGKTVFLYILFLLFVDWRIRKNERSVDLGFPNRLLRWLFYAILITLIGLFMKADTTSFIYFQF